MNTVSAHRPLTSEKSHENLGRGDEKAGCMNKRTESGDIGQLCSHSLIVKEFGCILRPQAMPVRGVPSYFCTLRQGYMPLLLMWALSPWDSEG